MIRSFHEYINEDASNNLDTTQYAKDVIGKIKGIGSEDESYTEIRELQYNEDHKFDLIIKVKKTSNPDFESDTHFKDIPWEEFNFKKFGFAIDANMFIDNKDLTIPEIIVTLIIDPSKEPKVYEELNFKLIDIIAHELNHTNQIGINREPFNVRPCSGKTRKAANTTHKYFSLPDEVESLILGMYTRSNEEDVEIDILFDKYLDPFVKDNKLSKAEYENIFELWLKHTLENYPDAKLSINNPKVSKIVDSI